MTCTTNAASEVALPPPIPRVTPGAHVEIELVSDDDTAEQMVLDIVPDKQADFAAGFLGIGTPLGRALLGQRAGATVPYVVADMVAVRILSVTRSRRAPAPDIATARDAAIQEAVSKAHLEDAVRLALTVDVKWGDYDPEAVESGWDTR